MSEKRTSDQIDDQLQAKKPKLAGTEPPAATSGQARDAQPVITSAKFGDPENPVTVSQSEEIKNEDNGLVDTKEISVEKDGREIAQATVTTESTQDGHGATTTTTTVAAGELGPGVSAAAKLGGGLPPHPSNPNPTLTVPEATQLPPETTRPPHGSDEWHRLRKLNHKEVERRRRESINQAIKELQDLLPTSNSNKSQVIKRAAEYIRRLKENENANIEKWTLEKLITDQAVNELANSNEKLKSELEKAYREIEYWKKVVYDSKKDDSGDKK